MYCSGFVIQNKKLHEFVQILTIHCMALMELDDPKKTAHRICAESLSKNDTQINC